MLSTDDVAPSSPFDTVHWRSIFDVTLTLKQARKSDTGKLVRIDERECRRAFRHFMNQLNRAVYNSAFRCLGKRIRVIPILEKNAEGRWYYHCAIEPPAHADGTRMDPVSFERLIHDCWAKVDWGYKRILVRDNADRGWIEYMLKPQQKSALEAWSDSIDWDSLHNPIANA
jgi:hypothetical protein